MLLIAGCSDFVDSFSPIPRQKLLEHPNGSSVRDCQGGPLPLGGVICAELAGDFHLGYARQLTDKSSLLFDLAF